MDSLNRFFMFICGASIIYGMINLFITNEIFKGPVQFIMGLCIFIGGAAVFMESPLDFNFTDNINNPVREDIAESYTEEIEYLGSGLIADEAETAVKKIYPKFSGEIEAELTEKGITLYIPLFHDDKTDVLKEELKNLLGEETNIVFKEGK